MFLNPLSHVNTPVVLVYLYHLYCVQKVHIISAIFFACQLTRKRAFLVACVFCSEYACQWKRVELSDRGGLLDGLDNVCLGVCSINICLIFGYLFNQLISFVAISLVQGFSSIEQLRHPNNHYSPLG